MNHHPLIQAASHNQVETYLRLGGAVPGSQPFREPGFIGCLSDFAHPIGNFAANLRLDSQVAHRLCEIATTRPVFSVYHLPGDTPAEAADILQRAGFRLSYRLLQMICEHPDPGPSIALREAETYEAKSKVARFMTEQFFSRQTEAFRRRIAAATAIAIDLELWDVEERGNQVGGVMFCHTEGLLGVYNLCVAASRRNRGIGGGILNGALAMARESHLGVTLQCDPVLQDWYTCRGFVATGFVDVYALPKREDDDIIL